MGNRLWVGGRHGQAAACFKHGVVASFYRVQHHATRHHVVHQFIGRNAKAVNGHALPADIGNANLRQKSGNLCFGDGVEKSHCALQAQLCGLRLQSSFFVAAAHQNKAKGLLFEQGGSLQQHIKRIGCAV